MILLQIMVGLFFKIVFSFISDIHDTCFSCLFYILGDGVAAILSRFRKFRDTSDRVLKIVLYRVGSLQR